MRSPSDIVGHDRRDVMSTSARPRRVKREYGEGVRREAGGKGERNEDGEGKKKTILDVNKKDRVRAQGR